MAGRFKLFYIEKVERTHLLFLSLSRTRKRNFNLEKELDKKFKLMSQNGGLGCKMQY